MNYLMLWKGETPTNRLNYIKSVLNKVTDEDTITIVSDSKFIRSKKIQWKSINTVEEALCKDYPYLKSIILQTSLVRWSDILRFYLLGQIANTLYVDTDIELIQRPIFNDLENPYLIKYNRRYWDLSMIYNGNNTMFFKNFLDLLIPIIQRRPERLNEYVYFFTYLNRWIGKNKVNEIDSAIYKHYELRGK